MQATRLFALGITAPLFLGGATALTYAIPGLPQQAVAVGWALAFALQLPIAFWICWPRRGILCLDANRLSLVSGGREVFGADIRTIRVGCAHARGEYIRYVMLELTFESGRIVAIGSGTAQDPSSYGRYRWRRPDWMMSEHELEMLRGALGVVAGPVPGAEGVS